MKTREESLRTKLHRVWMCSGALFGRCTLRCTLARRKGAKAGE